MSFQQRKDPSGYCEVKHAPLFFRHKDDELMNMTSYCLCNFDVAFNAIFARFLCTNCKKYGSSLRVC